MGEEVKGSSSSSSFRWNPTKEQVAILEGIYREGVRTPNAEQIQEITRRLRAFGEIQGKNVFYWFQNHKARQRQKMKQLDDRLAILTRLRHRRHHPLPTSPPPYPLLSAPPNVVYAAPYGIPVVAPQPAGASSGFYYETPTSTPQNAYLPGGPPVRMSMAKKLESKPDQCSSSYDCSSVVQQYSHSAPVPMHETLQLFPLQPSTGVLLEEERSGLTSPTSAASVLEEEETIPFFNFFAPSGGN